MDQYVPPHKKKRHASPSPTAEPSIMEKIQSEDEVNTSSANSYKDCTRLSESLWMFQDKKISSHALVFEGEQISGVFGTLPIVIKLVTPIELGTSEARILLKLNQNPHSHVISLIYSDTYSDGFTDYAYIALEKCHSDTIRQFVLNRRDHEISFDLELMLKFCEQLNCGLEYIHGKNIIHKDLKPDNVFLSLDQSKIKIADFGMSQEIESTSDRVSNSGHFGTKGYRAPETFDGAVISQKTDIFPLGIVLHFLLSNGEHPFGSNSDEWNSNVKNNTGIDLSHLLVSNVKTTQHLIKCCIEHELDCRPTIWEVISHPCWTGEDVECNFDFRFGCSPSSASECAPASDQWLSIKCSSRESYERNLEFLEAMKKLGFVGSSMGNFSVSSGTSLVSRPSSLTDGQNPKAVNQTTADANASLVIIGKPPSDWRKVKYLGRSVFGDVYLGYDADTGRQLAVRQIGLQNRSGPIQSKEAENLKTICQFLHGLSHNRIVQCYGSCEFANTMSIFMEYMPRGTVKEEIALNGALTEQVACKYTRQILEGQAYLNSFDIVHREITGRAVFQDLSGNVKLGGFHYARRLQTILTASERGFPIASVHWTSPEVLRSEVYDKTADVWSIGCTVVEMLTTRPPWYKLSGPVVIPKITTEPMELKLPLTTSKPCRDFLNQVFVEKDKRPCAEELLTHSWFSVL